jgi:polysaccharide pyruvyl transferase WcaK-like protein
LAEQQFQYLDDNKLMKNSHNEIKSTKNSRGIVSTKHFVLWGGWYGSHNVGDQVLLLTITDILCRMMGPVEFTVLTNNPGQVHAYTSGETACRIRAIHNRRQFFRVILSLARCDLFIFGGAVPFYQEYSHVLAMLVLVGLCRLFRKPYMTWTVSSLIVTNKLVKRAFKWVLDGAEVITCRDDNTIALFKSCGVDRPMYLSADSGFWLQPADDKLAKELIYRAGERDSTRPLVALTPRTLYSGNLEIGKHFNPKTPEQFEQEIDSFTAALDWLWEKGYQPIFVPMNTVAPDDDRIAARLVMSRAKYGKYALLINEEVKPRIAPAVFGQCSFSFEARVHGGITSAIGNCPVMMYAFAPKHAGIMKSMGLDRYILLEAEATPAKTKELLSDLEANRGTVLASLAGRLNTIRQDALIPCRLLESILD